MPIRFSRYVEVKNNGCWVWTGQRSVLGYGLIFVNRKVLHPLIEHLSSVAPTWLLFDADWMHTKQSRPMVQRLKKVVSVGRVRWIEGTNMTGKDNCCWYLFEARDEGQPAQFFGRL